MYGRWNENGGAHVSVVTAAFSCSVHSSPARSSHRHTDTAAVQAESKQIHVELGERTPFSTALILLGPRKPETIPEDIPQGRVYPCLSHTHQFTHYRQNIMEIGIKPLTLLM